MKIGLLGPDGTFTAEAGFRYCKKKNMKTEIIWYNSIEKCFDGVDKEEVERAVVPILNSTADASWVNETLKKLRNNGAVICDEQILDIRHNLLVLPRTKLEDIVYIHSKDKAIQQCKKYLSRYLSKAELVNENSTAYAAMKIKEIGEKSRAAIATLRAAELYGLKVLGRGIQDDQRNKTRFIVVGKKDSERTGRDKTTLLFEFKDVARSGILVDVLKEFSSREISLAYLQSLPKEGSLDEFTFYCDILGHREDENVREALRIIGDYKNLAFFKILGSYPVSA